MNPKYIPETPPTTNHLSANALVLAISASLLGTSALAASTETDANSHPKEVTLKKITVQDKQNPDASPYANPSAPYKAETLASPKFTKPIAETPKAITVLTKESIDDSGVTSLTDVLRSQPGITLGTGEGGNAFGDRFIIRGFEARNDVFVDGMRDPGVTTRETFGIEQVEIAKGPSSSFAGRGTTGGAINLVTKKPVARSFTTLEAGFGTDSYQRYTLDTNQALTDQLAVRLNALYKDRDIPGRDVSGNDGVSQQRQGALFAVQYAPIEKLTINFDYFYQASDDVSDGGVPWNSVTGKPIGGSHFYGQLNRDFWETSSNLATLTLAYNISDAMHITNQTRHGKTTNDYVLTIPAYNATTGVATAPSQTRNQENFYTGNQTNLVWDVALGGLAHTFVLGVEFSKEDVENLPYNDSNRSPNVGDVNHPNNYAWTGALSPNINRFSKTKLQTRSLYALDTIEFNDDWEVFLGLRHDTFDYDIYSGPTNYENGTQRDDKESFVNGHAGVVYSPWDNGNVYLSYSTSSDPSGSQLDAGTNCAYGGICADAAGNIPKPEKNRIVELGTKWELMDGDMLLTGSIFEIKKEDVISTLGAGTNLEVTQVGELQVRGIEIGLTGNITEKLSAQSGVTWLDTEVTKSDNPIEVGKAFPNVAEKSAYAQLRYQLLDRFAIGGTITYTGEIHGGTPNEPANNNTLDSVMRYDLMAEYAITAALSARLNLLNATDATYYTALYRSGTPFTYIGEARSGMLTLEYKM